MSSSATPLPSEHAGGLAGAALAVCLIRTPNCPVSGLIYLSAKQQNSILACFAPLPVAAPFPPLPPRQLSVQSHPPLPASQGGVLHTINPRLHPELLMYVIDHAEDKVLFVDLTFYKGASALLPKLKTLKALVVMTDRCAPPPQQRS